MMKSKLFEPKRRIERSYYRSIKKLMEKLINLCRSAKSYEEIVDKLKEYAESDDFRKDAKGIAGSMVTHLFSDGHKTWRQAAKKAGRGREIYKALKNELKGSVGDAYNEAVKRNAEYISSLPLDLAERATKMAQEAYLKGVRYEDVADNLFEVMGNLSVSRAKLIARTEVSKANTELTRARSEEMGLNWYCWRTSSDERVRKSHEIMEGVYVNWNDPPSPEKLAKSKYVYGNYHAGNIFNCRCYPEPLVELNFIKNWPIKVYQNGEIRKMTRAQFIKIGGDTYNGKHK